jgi:pyruvate formate lyase activating enzyme
LKSLVFDIRRYCIHDGPGIRTTVFLKGCPLRCRWCHNPESQEVETEQVTVKRILDQKTYETQMTVGQWMSAKEVMEEIEKDEIFYAESGGGITFSGGEPLLQAKALCEIMEHCSGKGYHTAIDTSGHAEPTALKMTMELADLWLFDLKLMDDQLHVEYTGVSNELALFNLELLAREGEEILIRFPLIPGITDDKKNLGAIVNKMDKLGLQKIEVLPYHSIARDKYHRMDKHYLLGDLEDPEKETIKEIKEFFALKGLSVIS